MSINQVTISGNLTRDPELRSPQGGMAVMSLGVAVNDRVKNQQSGEWEDRPNFVDCVVFGRRAEALSRYLSKGSKVAVSGRLRYSAWEAKDGGRRSKLEVIVDELDLMSQRQGQNAPQAAQQPAHGAQTPYAAPAPAQAAPGPQNGSYGQMDLYDEDIPF